MTAGRFRLTSHRVARGRSAWSHQPPGRLGLNSRNTRGGPANQLLLGIGDGDVDRALRGLGVRHRGSEPSIHSLTRQTEPAERLAVLDLVTGLSLGNDIRLAGCRGAAPSSRVGTLLALEFVLLVVFALLVCRCFSPILSPTRSASRMSRRMVLPIRSGVGPRAVAVPPVNGAGRHPSDACADRHRADRR